MQIIYIYIQRNRWRARERAGKDVPVDRDMMRRSVMGWTDVMGWRDVMGGRDVMGLYILYHVHAAQNMYIILGILHKH